MSTTKDTEKRAWTCPGCGEDLRQAGVWDVREAMSRWDRWDLDDEGWTLTETRRDDDLVRHLRCQACETVLDPDRAAPIWEALNLDPWRDG